MNFYENTKKSNKNLNLEFINIKDLEKDSFKPI